MKKRSFLLVAMLFLVTFLVTACSSEEKLMVPKVEKDLYVYDQGNFLDDEVEKKTNKLLDKLEELTTIEFAVITVPTLNGMEVIDYATDLGNVLGIGKEEENNGILLLISKEDEKVAIATGEGIDSILTDSRCGRILDQFFVPARKEDDYDKATFETVQAVINVLSASDDYSFEMEEVDSELQVKEVPDWIVLLIAAIIILAFIVIAIKFGGGGSSGYYGDSYSGSSEGSFGSGSFDGGGASR